MPLRSSSSSSFYSSLLSTSKLHTLSLSLLSSSSLSLSLSSLISRWYNPNEITSYNDKNNGGDGQNGVKSLPSCDSGYGNNEATGSICQICIQGYYSKGGSSSVCDVCRNAPAHSSYTHTGEKNSDCAFICDTGYTTTSCYTPLQYFFLKTVGVDGLIGLAIAFFVLVLAPLIYYRYKLKYEWSGIREEVNIYLFNKKRENQKMNDDGIDEPNRIRSMKNRLYAKEQRKEYQLVDSDLVYHACRVNLLGTNHPFQSSGIILL